MNALGSSWAAGPRPRRRRSRVLGAVVGFVLAASLTAVAAWLVTVDDAPVQGKFGTLVAPTIQTATLSPDKTCFPGGTCDASLKIDNPNGALIITGVAVPTTYRTTGCSVWFTANTQTGLAIPVPAGVTDNVIVPDALKADSATDTACQGVAALQNAKLTFSTP